MRGLYAALGIATIAVAAILTSSQRAPATVTRNDGVTSIATPQSAFDPGMSDAHAAPDVREVAFTSASLARTMPYSIYLPPGYAASTARYPVLYMLHGMSGTNSEWRSYGLFDEADAMIRSGEIDPLIIVLPQGDKAYWVDHAIPTDRAPWGAYMAKDVIADVDANFRTRADAKQRAVGGVSMGAHGAMQLALNFPGTFSVVGAHSLVLRRYDTAPAYFGSEADWAKRDPMQLAAAKTLTMRSMDVWIDIGRADPWSKLAEQFDSELTSLGIAHQWHEWNGDHSASYWREHLPAYLRFYSSSLASHDPAHTD